MPIESTQFFNLETKTLGLMGKIPPKATCHRFVSSEWPKMSARVASGMSFLGFVTRCEDLEDLLRPVWSQAI